MKKPKSWLRSLARYGGIALLLLGIYVLVALLGGAIMRLFGFTYQSLGSLILFFLVVGLVGFPCEMLAKGLPRALLHMGKISIRAAKLLFLLLDVTFTVFFMLLVDYFMKSVSATDLSVIIIAVIMALLDVGDIKEESEDSADDI